MLNDCVFREVHYILFAVSSVRFSFTVHGFKDMQLVGIG